MVLEIDQEKQRISLGIKQMHEDPWQNAIPDAYKPGMVVHGKVTKITNFGVFVELDGRASQDESVAIQQVVWFS